jgi:ATP synthase F1 gamma subunit
MQNIHQIREEIDFAKTLKVVTQVYEELSVIQMQRIRGSVFKTRNYLGSLAGVFYNVKQSHKKMIKLLSKDKEVVEDLSPFSMLPKNGKSLAVLLTANEKLSGDINFRVFNYFTKFITSNTCDVMIIGRIGRELYQQQGIQNTYTYFEVPDTNTSMDDIKRIVYHLVNYQNINVFYGKFETLLNQKPVNSNISGEEELDSSLISKEAAQAETAKEDEGFLFEPSLEEIHHFFETQFFSALFKQTVYESQLARYASRIKAMDEALQNIEEKTATLYSGERKVKRSIQNKKQLERISGITIWNH